jgi:prevent-host-death family protein
MTSISINEIQQDFAGYLSRVQAGDVLLVTSDGQPVAEIKPVEKPAGGLRPFGLTARDFRTPDDFNDPLPADVLFF